jgi:tripartite-type tricarboxylate transporter receptor subunit TctC
MTSILKRSLAMLVLASGAAWADYPERAVTTIVPFPPGGSVDPIARALQLGMQSALGGPLVIVNQPGAGGTLGTAKVAKSTADGYTLGITAVGPLTTQPHMNPALGYGIGDFEYICRTHVTPQALVVPANSPYRTLKDLVDDARSNPQKVSLASTGTGSLPHLASVEFGQIAGFNWLHVPTKGDSEAATLVMSGEITGWVAGLQTISSLSSRLRVLGILEAERSAVMPTVATFREQGYDIISRGWGGLVAPKGTPAPVIAKLSAACEKAAKAPAFETVLRTLLIPQGYQPSGDFSSFVHSESERYRRLIESTGANVRK